MVDNEETLSDPPSRSVPGLTKLLVVAAVASAVYVGYTQFGDQLSLEGLANKEAELRQFQQDHPVLVYGVAFTIYVAVTALSLPGATGMTLALGWFFGFWRSLVLVSFASTTGATLAFLLSRYLLRDSIQSKFGDRLASFNQALQDEGSFYLFTVRLIPAVPFFVINVVMGLTPIRTMTYWWVSQIGMLPGTAVYVYFGSSFPDLKTLAVKGPGGILSPPLIAAFVILGLFPIVVKKLMQRFRPPAIQTDRN